MEGVISGPIQDLRLIGSGPQGSMTPSLHIIISIEKPPDFISVDNRTFVNFNKANWVGFTEFTESTFTALPIPTDVNVNSAR